MERWTTLEPVKLHGSQLPSTKKPWKPSPPDRYQYIGPLPADIHLLILDFLPVTSFSSYARVSRAFARLAQDERLWKRKCDVLGLQKPSISSLLVNLEAQVTGNDSRSHALPVLEVQDEKDDFGDFSSASFSPNMMSQWNGRETEGSVRSSGFADAYFDISRPISRTVYIHAHTLLLILLRRFKAAPHLVLAELFPPPSPSLLEQSKTLSLLSRFLSPTIQPISSWKDLRLILASVVDRFQAGVLAAFESADSRADEGLMSEAAWASWECWDPSQSGSEWELGRVWAEKLEIFYQHGQWDPLQNFT
jgi:recyclin-1